MALPRGAGDLRDRITFLRPSKVGDGQGGFTVTEAEQTVVWARVTVPQARDGVIADQTRELRTHEVVIRGAAFGAKQGDIIAWKDNRLLVRTTRPDAQWLVLDCVTETRK